MLTPSSRLAILALSACAAAAPGSVSSQAPGGTATRLTPPSFHVERWGLEEGLPGLAVEDLSRHDDGFLWLITSGIVVRFDGREFRPYRPADHPGLPGSRFRGVAAGPGDSVWVVSADGHLVVGSGGSFEVVDQVDEPLHDVVRGPAGQIWLRSTRRVWTLDGDGLRVMAALERWGISRDYGDLRPQIVVVDEGAWVRAGLEVVLLDSGGREIRREPAHQEVLATGPAGELLLPRLSEGGSAEVWDGQGRLRTTVPGGADRIRLVDREGRGWRAVDTRIDVYLPGQAAPHRSFDLGSGVGRLFEDVEGNIWATTASAGLVRVHEVPFTTVGPESGIGRSQVYRVFRGRGGSVLAIDRALALYRIGDGTVEAGLERLAGDGSVSRDIGAALEDDRGTLWVTWSNGPESWLEGIRTSGERILIPVGAGVVQIVEDPGDSDALWVALSKAVPLRAPHEPTGNACIDGQRGCILRVQPYAPAGPVVEGFLPGRLPRHITPDGEGGLWMLEGSRLTHISVAGEVSVYGGDGSLGDVELRAVHVDAEGTVWVGTYGAGLMRFSGRRFGTIRQADGLGEDVVSTILEDDAGNLWMGGNESVHRVGRDEAKAFLDGRRDRVEGVRYGTEAGLANPEGSGWPGLRADDGTLWFPTFGGAAQVDPTRALALDGRPPRVVVEGFRWDGGRSRTGSTVPLERGVRAVEIAFTATSLRNPRGLRFEYRLEGADPDWVPAGDQRSVRYTNLPAGRRLFRVRARTAGGVWSAEGGEVVLAVPPFFYETVWFYLVLIAGTVLLVAGVIRRRERQGRARAAALEHQVRLRTREVAEALEIVQAQADQLRTLDEAKSRFFSNVTHELRTPLTLLLGPLVDLSTGKRGPLPEPALRDLDLIRSNARRLLQLVDQLLDVARLESGEMPLHPSRGDLRRVLSRITEGFRARSRASEVEFDARLPDGVVEAVFDPDLVEKVLVNLLDNAFKFTPAGGSVTLRATVEGEERHGAALVLEVADTGRGIPRGELDRVFDRFHRVGEEGPGAAHGTGVGLSLVRELVELQGGTIEVESAPDQGTRFHVRLPIDRIDASDAAPEAPAAVPHAGGSLDQPVALFVEDHPDLREWMREHLEPRFRLFTASNGRKGLEIARSVIPDVVISDIMMPEMDGQELCSAIKSDPELDFVPVILLTARSARADRLEGLRHGADAYLSKPFDMEELLLTIENVVATRRNLRKLLTGESLPEARPSWELRPEQDESRRFLDHLYRKLAEHIRDEELSVESLAESMGLSRSTLYRRIDEHLSQPAMEVIWSYRLEQAAAWLRETDVSVSEVAYGVGFKSVSHFSRRFRDRFGQSPSAYRDRRDDG